MAINEKTVIDGGNGVTADQLSELFNQIKSGQINGYKMQALLEGRNPFAFTNLQPWKIINFKAWQSANELISKVMGAHHRIDVNVINTFQRYVLPEGSKTRPAKLILLTPADLGFKKPVYYQDICRKAERYELKLCDPRMLFQLVLQIPLAMLAGETFILAMTAMTDPSGLPVLFSLTGQNAVHDHSSQDELMGIGYTNGRGNCRFELTQKLIFEL